MKIQAGFGKREITCFIPGLGMMGYGQTYNVVKEVATPLFSRAMYLQDEGGRVFIMVHLELAFVTIAIKEEIIIRLKMEFCDNDISDANVMVTAQHTHSAPGGYSHYPFYNFTIPGFQLRVFNTICNGIVESIKAAKKDLTAVNLHWGSHKVSEDKDIAFNRSMKAYLNNSNSPKLKVEEWHLGVNREMQGIYVSDEQGNEKAYLNWFGVHATSISSNNQKIHHDNKGVAAALYEKKHPGSMAFFMQEAAGDVSPNFVWDKKIKRMRGKFHDQYQNAEHNGEMQFRESEKVIRKLEIKGKIECYHQYFDMALAAAPAAHGVAFFMGTPEGLGIPKSLGKVVQLISTFVEKTHLFLDSEKHKSFYEAHSPKHVILDHRNGMFIGIPLNIWKKLPPIPEASVNEFRKAAKNESINTLPWIPEILPFQIIAIGPLLIVAVSGEITTESARRLKESIEMKLNNGDIEKVIISSYSNCYMGYITTPEEYQTQCYEGGHTTYGSRTLNGVIKGFEGLVEAYISKQHYSFNDQQSFRFPKDELSRRTVN